MYDGLRALDINDWRIHAEAFGPSSLQRTGDNQLTGVELAPIASESVPVIFMTSTKEARWNPGGDSLFDLAEQRDLSPPFGCRAGSCGSCRTLIPQGTVTYARPPEFQLPAEEALICCALPAAGTELLHLGVFIQW